MGNAAYDARREAEREEAERGRALAAAAKEAAEAVRDFANGKASLLVTPCWTGSAVGNSGGWTVRLVRDVK